MVILSAHFTVLACLCAALPFALPPPVEAAHLYGRYSMDRHAASPHPHHRTSSDPPTHGYDGKHYGHKAPDRRAPELPPLLRRYDYKKADGHRGQDFHDYAHPKASRSAFARSRYRRELAPHSRRSSIYVSGEHGNTYLVSRTPPRTWGNARRGASKQSSHSYNRRQVDESSLIEGRIDIMGSAQSAGSTQRLASLMVDSNPIDWTSGQSSAAAFQLNASTANQTQFIMIPMEDSSNAAGSFVKHVTLATEVFDASITEMVMYCATYDPDPGSASLLLMTPCTGAAQSATPANDAADPCSEAANDVASNPRQSQIFSYDPSSGKIQPISVAVSSPSVDDSSADPPECAGARVRRDTGNSTTSSSTRPLSTLTSTAPTASASQHAQNVTLVFVAGSVEVPASSPSASIGQVLTTTITTTVVATVTATGPPNRTVTPAQAAVSVSTSSTPSLASQSTTTMAPSISTAVSRSSSSLSFPSSVLATATSRTPASAFESFEVEIVGVTPSLTASSSSTSSATTSSSNTSASPSLNAQAVASSIANAMVHPQRRVFVSASAKVNPT